jgi:hypothetical protein
MIFFFGDGRLGNQLFQYSFIRTVESSNQWIVTFSFNDIADLFESLPKVCNIGNRLLKLAIRRVGMRLLDFLARARLISSYKVNTRVDKGYVVPDTTYSRTSGMLPVAYVYPCFVQSEGFFSAVVVEALKIKERYCQVARSYINAIPQGTQAVFIHIRRTDYLDFSVLGEVGADLPMAYYRNGIKWFEDNLENPFFVFLTDDPTYIENCYHDIANKKISENSLFVDFSIMTLCEYGIMSNSSFSWWAAYMMKNKKKVFAPKYWLGWKSKIEYHRGITPSFAQIVEVTQ